MCEQPVAQVVYLHAACSTQGFRTRLVMLSVGVMGHHELMSNCTSIISCHCASNTSCSTTLTYLFWDTRACSYTAMTAKEQSMCSELAMSLVGVSMDILGIAAQGRLW